MIKSRKNIMKKGMVILVALLVFCVAAIGVAAQEPQIHADEPISIPNDLAEGTYLVPLDILDAAGVALSDEMQAYEKSAAVTVKEETAEVSFCLPARVVLLGFETGAGEFESLTAEEPAADIASDISMLSYTFALPAEDALLSCTALIDGAEQEVALFFRWDQLKTAVIPEAEDTATVSLCSTSEVTPSALDKDNLPDGIYSVYVEMIKMNRSSKSMANNSINHTVKLEVENGKYYATLDFKGITIENRFGYLQDLSYYVDGYAYNNYGGITGSTAPATVLSTQKDSDGNDVIDQYNDANNLYPDLVKIEIVPQAIADEDSVVPLHVFVPIMESIAAGNGDQDVLMQIDWSTLKGTTADDSAFQPEEPVEQSAALDYTDSATGIRVTTEKGVFDDGVTPVITSITSGDVYDKAKTALSSVGSTFAFYNILFKDASGSEVEPNGTVTLSFPIPSGYDSTKVAVYRINDDGTKTLVKGTVNGSNYDVVVKDPGNYALVNATAAASTGTTGTTGTTNSTTKTTTSPQTGDEEQLVLWLLVMLASGTMLAAFVISEKRRTGKGEK